MAEIAGALVGLVGAGLQYSAQQEQAQIELMNLRFQQQMARQNQRMASATRTDAYGNTQRYNQATNTWETDLTPTQKSIVGAGEQQQLKQLTEDATRNRLILEEQRQRGLEAVPDYNKALAGFRYDEAPSRASDEDKLFTLMSLQNQDAVGGDRQAIGRTLLRQGRGADYATFIKSMDDAQGQNIGANLTKAYEASIPQYQQDVQSRQQHYLPLLEQLQKTMAGGMSSAPNPYSTVPQELNAIEGQQAQLMQSAGQAGASGVGSAFDAYARAAGQSPSLAGIASALAGAGKGGGNRSGNQQSQYGLVPNTAASDPGVGYTDTYPGQWGTPMTGQVPLPPVRPDDSSLGSGWGDTGSSFNSYGNDWGGDYSGF
jgi:hypothetical protein